MKPSGRCWKTMKTDLGEMSLPELIELMHRIADEIESRAMQAAE